MLITITPKSSGPETLEFVKMLRNAVMRFLDRRGIVYNFSSPGLIQILNEASVSEFRPTLNGLIGIHSLLKSSSFDPEKRRYTSFASLAIDSEISSDPIRRYVFNPYTLVKNCITGKESDKVHAFFEGDLDIV